MNGVSASPPSSLCRLQSKTQIDYCSNRLTSVAFVSRSPSPLNVNFSGLSHEARGRLMVSCNSSTRPGGLGSGDSDSKGVLDAFFLGKALAEALTERIESTVGEFFSTVGRLQAEQQKQVQDFQEEVLERAKKAKERAAREAMEAQGLVYKSTDGVVPGSSPDSPPRTTLSPSSDAAETGVDSPTNTGYQAQGQPVLEASNDV
ncbi:uncharacterized protein LOC119999652 [Tripterygium wilfordii]|uniref:uncharacterized protein LOC119999652 n=1 Tax=Tripterygium wilfordii TaxID=458696 RepID=UPI0018F85081|nr:uncharacterized protein LOC119999652 [Tripterygium wilfordii]